MNLKVLRLAPLSKDIQTKSMNSAWPHPLLHGRSCFRAPGTSLHCRWPRRQISSSSLDGNIIAPSIDLDYSLLLAVVLYNQHLLILASAMQKTQRVIMRLSQTLRLQIPQCRSYLTSLGSNVGTIYRHGAPGKRRISI